MSFSGTTLPLLHIYFYDGIILSLYFFIQLLCHFGTESELSQLL